LVEVLRTKDFTVEPAGIASQPFFKVEGTTLLVDGTTVEVFEFPDEPTMWAAMPGLGPAGELALNNPPRITTIECSNPPYFYSSGRIIVFYAGNDARIIQALADMTEGRSLIRE
jgi:hypothetical protein